MEQQYFYWEYMCEYKSNMKKKKKKKKKNVEELIQHNWAQTH
jgi:hypothetical protein